MDQMNGITDLYDIAKRWQWLVDVGTFFESISRSTATIRSFRTCRPILHHSLSGLSDYDVDDGIGRVQDVLDVLPKVVYYIHVQCI